MALDNRTKHQARDGTGRVTVRDVAQAAEVSPMTVSNVVNGRYHLMGVKTRERVEGEIKRLNYRPHFNGRNLRLSQRLSIGMIVVDESPTFLADPFITQVVAGLSNYLGERGYGLLLQGLAAEELEESIFVRNIGTDGLCALLSGSPSTRRRIVETLSALGQPLVVLQETVAPEVGNTCVVRQDDFLGGRLLATHLLAKQVKRFVMLEPGLEWPAIRERERGVRDAIGGASGEASLQVVACGKADFVDTQAALAREIEIGALPDAILAGNDQMGIAALKLLRERGVRVPEDVFVTGFNGFEFWQYTDPVLTTVLSPAYEIGARGGMEILRYLRDGAFPAPDVLLPVELQIGGST